MKARPPSQAIYTTSSPHLRKDRKKVPVSGNEKPKVSRQPYTIPADATGILDADRQVLAPASACWSRCLVFRASERWVADAEAPSRGFRLGFVGDG